eukprot:199447-Hanusia_phi.AAC.1
MSNAQTTGPSAGFPAMQTRSMQYLGPFPSATRPNSEALPGEQMGQPGRLCPRWVPQTDVTSPSGSITMF